MDFLQELLRFNRLNVDQKDTPDEDLLGGEPNEAEDEFDGYVVGDEPDDDEFNYSVGGDEPVDGEVDNADPPDGETDPAGDFDGEDVGNVEDGEPEDPDRAGLIRQVNKAHLVYKRSTDDGSYEEMWTYNVTNLRDEMSVRKAILSGTDIPPNKTQSPDGSQHYELWTAGNAEVMLIKGLPQ